MKKTIALLGALLLSSGALSAQTTVVSGNTIDSDGIAWVGGSISVQFVPNPSQSNINVYNINGVALNPSVLTQGPVTLSTSGSFSVSVYTNSAISPAGSQWQFTICPLSTSKCGILLTPAVGSAQSLTAAITAAIPAPRFPAVVGNYGYADVEAIQQNAPGQLYYNVTELCYKTYNGVAFSCLGGGGLTPPILITQGGTGATTAPAALANLGGQPSLGVIMPTLCAASPAPSWCAGSDIGAWINASMSQITVGAEIDIPPDTYVQTTEIVPTKKVTIKGVTTLSQSGPNSVVFTKAASMTTPAIAFYEASGARGSSIEGITFNGQTGNTGVGILISANWIKLQDVVVTGMGSHGIRIGVDSPSNVDGADFWVLNRVQSGYNLGDGINIGGQTLTGGYANANAGQATAVSSQGNIGDGFKVGWAINNVFMDSDAEANHGYGIHLAANSGRNTIIGGDAHEHNVLGDCRMDFGAFQSLIMGIDCGGGWSSSSADTRNILLSYLGSGFGTLAPSTPFDFLDVSNGPQDLSVAVTKGLLLENGSGVGMVMGVQGSGYAGYIQARQTAAGGVAGALLLNPLGGNVHTGRTIAESLTLDAFGSTVINNISQTGNQVFHAVADPPAPTLANSTDVSCSLLDSTNYCYKLQGGATNGYTHASPSACITTGSTSNKNCVAVSRPASIQGDAVDTVSRSTTAGSELLCTGLAIASTELSVIDTGVTCTGAPASTVNATLGFISGPASLSVVGNIGSATVNATSYVSAPSVKGTTGIGSGTALGTITLGAAGVVGTGATAACNSGFLCDQFSGEIKLLTGTGAGTTGLFLTVNFTTARANFPVCLVQVMNQTSGNQLSANLVYVGTPAGNQSFTLTTTSALVSSTQYAVNYICGGY
jgi:hypothetical protein